MVKWYVFLTSMDFTFIREKGQMKHPRKKTFMKWFTLYLLYRKNMGLKDGIIFWASVKSTSFPEKSPGHIEALTEKSIGSTVQRLSVARKNAERAVKPRTSKRHFLKRFPSLKPFIAGEKRNRSCNWWRTGFPGTICHAFYFPH